MAGATEDFRASPQPDEVYRYPIGDDRTWAMDERKTQGASTVEQACNRLCRPANEARRLDLAVYCAIADTPTPSLDHALSRLSRAADYSRLSIASALVLLLAGGCRGRAAATMGLASVAVTSTVVNLGAKTIVRRRRPDRVAQDLPRSRQVPMPSSSAFPSGHSAAAFALATGVGQELPIAGFLLRGLAAVVAYSRAHTGVHPGDVLAGALLGGALAQATTHALNRVSDS